MERIAEYHNRRADGEITGSDILHLFDRQQRHCFYCHENVKATTGKGKNWQLDHRVPVCRGGSNDIDNLCIACRLCNHRKYTQTAEEFIR